MYTFCSCPEVPKLHCGVTVGPGLDHEAAALHHIGEQQQRWQQQQQQRQQQRGQLPEQRGRAADQPVFQPVDRERYRGRLVQPKQPRGQRRVRHALAAAADRVHQVGKGRQGYGRGGRLGRTIVHEAVGEALDAITHDLICLQFLHF